MTLLGETGQGDCKRAGFPFEKAIRSGGDHGSLWCNALLRGTHCPTRVLICLRESRNPHFKIFASIRIEGKKHCTDKNYICRTDVQNRTTDH